MKKTIKNITRTFGFDVVKYPNDRSTLFDRIKLLQNHNIDLILDVGANVGQFADETFGLGYKNHIVSFEPMSKEYEVLKHNSKNRDNWIIAPQMAIGDIDGQIDINISRNSVSSSLLPLSEYAKDNTSATEFITKEKIDIHTLNKVAPEYMSKFKSVFLKIDVQGYEQNVLKGANEILGNIKGLQLEFSLKPIYDGETSMLDMLNLIDKLGFEPYYFLPHVTIDKIGRLMQIDGIFFRKSK